MLLIDYNPEEYQDHMHRWALWLASGEQVESGLKKSKPPAPITRDKKSKPGLGIPKGYDTEVAINAAVKSLLGQYHVHYSVVVAQFLSGLTPAEKAAGLGLTPADFRRKLAEARKMVNQYMAGIANPLRYTYEARKPG